jgi:hypothetical protein
MKIEIKIKRRLKKMIKTDWDFSNEIDAEPYIHYERVLKMIDIAFKQELKEQEK